MKTPDLETRFARLERDIRRIRMALLLLLVVAAGLVLAEVLPRGRANAVAVFAATALLLAGAEIAVHVWRRSSSVPDIVRAKKFEVVDDRGHIFVEIGETLDGRGAVVTHDGDLDVVLGPARPPIPGEPRSDAPRTFASTETTHRNDASAPGDAPVPHPSSNAASNAQSQTHPAVDVRLSYRGDGVYEAKITERKSDNGAPPEQSSRPDPAERSRR